jgi:hypothetical protein
MRFSKARALARSQRQHPRYATLTTAKALTLSPALSIPAMPNRLRFRIRAGCRPRHYKNGSQKIPQQPTARTGH